MPFNLCFRGFTAPKNEFPSPKPTLPQLFRQKVTPFPQTPISTLPFQNQLLKPHPSLTQLRKLAWKGVPDKLRGRVWRLLLHYEPVVEGEVRLQEKHEEYWQLVKMHEREQRSEEDEKAKRIIEGDIIRTCPENKFHRVKKVQDCLIRVLLVWHFRHPASGYIQGISDITTPFLTAFIQQLALQGSPDQQIASITQEQWRGLQADIYWCMSKVLEQFQQNYLKNFKGVKLAYKFIEELLKKIDPVLHLHLKDHNVDFFCLTLRQLTTLLIRVFDHHLITRLFDTYLSEEQNFPKFVLYVLVGIYLRHSNQILRLSDEMLTQYLQSLPSRGYKRSELEMLFGQAYVYMNNYPL